MVKIKGRRKERKEEKRKKKRKKKKKEEKKEKRKEKREKRKEKENATVGYWIIYGTSNSIGKGIWEEIQKKKRKSVAEEK